MSNSKTFKPNTSVDDLWERQGEDQEFVFAVNSFPFVEGDPLEVTITIAVKDDWLGIFEPYQGAYPQEQEDASFFGKMFSDAGIKASETSELTYTLNPPSNNLTKTEVREKLKASTHPNFSWSKEFEDHMRKFEY